MGPIQVVVTDANNLVLEVTPTPSTTVILDRGIAGPVGPAGPGDVNGPASATDNAVARFDGTTGKLIQNSVVLVSDTGAVSGVTDLTASGAVTLSGGTANGVAYLNGSKVLTTGSALTFNGTALVLNTPSTGLSGVLTTNGTANLGLYVTGTGYSYAGASANEAWLYAANTTNIGSDGNFPIKFLSNNSEQMRLTSTGLGIGTSSPSYPLHVNATGNGTKARFTNGTTTLDLYCGGTEVYTGTAGSSTSWAYATANTYIAGYVNGTERMRIDSSGNVGIGTSSPNTKLQVSGNAVIGDGTIGAPASGYQLRITNDSSEYYDFGRSASTGYFTINASQASPYRGFNWSYGGTAQMTLDSSGNLGLGVTPVSQNGKVFHIDGGAGAADIRLTNNATGSAINNGGLLTLSGSDIYLWNLENNILSFGTNNTERARITSGGDVGIGTSSPLTKLDVVGTITSSNPTNTVGQTADVVLNTYNTNFGPTNTATLQSVLNNTTTGENDFFIKQFNHISGSTSEIVLKASSGSSGFVSLYTANTERARITSGGDLLVGTTSFPGAGSATTGAALGSAGSVSVQRAAATPCFFGRSNDGEIMALYSGTTQRGVVSISGATTTYGSVSDYRLKENITPLTGVLSKVMALKPSAFNFKEFPNQQVNGFIAHEVAEVEPIAVTGEKDGVGEDNKPIYQSVDPAKLVPLLTAAMQEQQAIITALTARVAALESI
jgi:hypothetical protein